MADWYVSSVAWAAIPQWAATHAYSTGDIIRPLATPAEGQERCFRCTTPGTSGGTEPATWFGTTTTSGTAVFTQVTGQSTYGWGAAAGTWLALYGNTTRTAGDRAFFSSDHSEATTSSVYNLRHATTGLAAVSHFISVSRAGSVPPVAADVTPGASISTSAAVNVSFDYHGRYEGLSITASSTGAAMLFNNSTNGMPLLLKNCTLTLSGGSASPAYQLGNGKITFDNTTLTFGHTGQSLYTQNQGHTLFEWKNTASAIGGTTFPTLLFQQAGANTDTRVLLKNLDLSALGSGKTLFDSTSAADQFDALMFNCRLNASVTITNSPPSGSPAPTIDLVNCDSGATNYRCERYTPNGQVTTELSIVHSGGASDGTTAFSRKMVSNANAQPFTLPLESFPLDSWNGLTGSARTATVEIISSGTLTNSDIALVIDYLGSGSYPIGSSADDFMATILSTPSNQPTSTATWAASPSTPVKQKLAVTFTPQLAGWVRGTVRLGKASTTVYVDPTMTIT